MQHSWSFVLTPASPSWYLRAQMTKFVFDSYGMLDRIYDLPIGSTRVRALARRRVDDPVSFAVGQDVKYRVVLRGLSCPPWNQEEPT